MSRRGFSLLEIMVALAILTLVSISLMPLMIRLTEADVRNRKRAEAWRKAQSGLTALHLNDSRSWQPGHSPYDLKWEQTAGTGSVAWSRLSVTPAGQDKPVLDVYVESDLPRFSNP